MCVEVLAYFSLSQHVHCNRDCPTCYHLLPSMRISPCANEWNKTLNNSRVVSGIPQLSVLGQIHQDRDCSFADVLIAVSHEVPQRLHNIQRCDEFMVCCRRTDVCENLASLFCFELSVFNGCSAEVCHCVIGTCSRTSGRS